MNISNINLKCDGTLPKGKFLECTEHTNIFSYCSKCDMLLCSNCIINHFFDNKELHSSEDDIMPINIYFNNFGKTYKKFLNSLDSFESMIETKPMDAVLKALYDNMGILKGIQAKLNKILEHYNNLIKWYEKENKPLLDKTDFIKTKGKLSLMFHAYNIGNYDELSSRYQNNGYLSFGQDLLRSVPSNIVSFVISSIFNSSLSYIPMIEMILVEIKTKEFIEFMKRFYSMLMKKLLMFHCLLFVLECFAIYYLCLFCTIYKNSQTSWFTGCVYSFITSIIMNLVISIALSGLRKLSLIYKWRYAYNLQLFINDIL